MKLQPRNLVLLLPAAACLVEATRTPLTGDPGPILTGMMGFFLGWWAMAAVKQAIPVIASGYVLGFWAVAVDSGFMKDNIGSALILIPAGACFFFWPKIEKAWRRDR